MNANNMIKIKINNIHFREKKYILSVIFEDILGINVSYEISNSESYELILPNKKNIIIPDIFLSSQQYQKEWENYQYPKLCYNTDITIKNKHKIFGLYGNKDFSISEKSITINNDIIGTAFVFLSRIEELNNNHDKFGRYQYKNSIAERFNIITRPVVNEYIEFIKDALEFLEPNIIFKKYNYNIILTHDIDMIKKWNWKGIIKHSIFNFMKKDFLKNYKNIFLSKFNHTIDPYYNFSQIMNISEEHNINSTFLFMAIEKNEFDFRYPIKKARKGINNILIKKEHNIGIHLSKLSYNNFQNASNEINRLKQITEKDIIYNRFHYLMFDIKNSWDILEKNQIKYDLTLGFPEFIGFRCGICYPFKVFDLKRKKKLNLTEIPLNIMDVTITEYMIELNKVEKDCHIANVINNIKKYDGTLNLLWHNNSYIDYLNSANEELLDFILKQAVE
ncbi:MAG: hypothetical protein CBC84_003030 [Pelagibacteraceae bacterium TMED124]|nr:MAG: hypothetical protein CBC84_003030 [Pelagibacteraceae bacterium TMED124]